MRYARLGLIVCAFVTIGALVSLREERRAETPEEPDVLQIAERGGGTDIFVRFDRPVVEPAAIGSPAPLGTTRGEHAVEWPARAGSFELRARCGGRETARRFQVR